MAHGVPASPRGHPRDRRRCGRAERGCGRGELGADVVLADEGPEPGGRLLAEGGVGYARELVERARAAAWRSSTTLPRSAPSTASCRSGRATRSTRSAPAPDPRHRRDRAAAALPRQRPARRDALRRRPPAGLDVRDPARRARRRRDRGRSRPARRAGADRRRGRAGLRGGPAGERQRRAEGRAEAPRRGGPERRDGARGDGARTRVERGRRPAGLDGQRTQLRSGPAGGVGRQRARDLAGRAGRREDLVRRGARLLHARARARGGARGRPAHRPQRARGGGAVGCVAAPRRRRARPRRRRLARTRS